jgi:alkylhydroperoxidase family enzyme
VTTPGTFAQLLSPDSVDEAELRRRGYGAQLELVRVLLGVVPNAGPLLEIWPTAFRSYNMLVPNFLNLPPLLFGAGAPKQLVGLAMYVSSRAAGCAYCSAHSCSFALRRGATAATLATAYGSDGAERSPAERAVIAAAEGLSLVPSTFTAADRAALEQHFTPSDAEWVALSIVMMGFLNKFMDVMGVPLEGQIVADAEPVIGGSGWTPGKHGTGAAATGGPPHPDTLWTMLGVFRYAPQAVMRERRWTAGVPARWPDVGVYLREQTGHDFGVLGRLRHARARRALATMLRDNLAARDTQIGLPVKTLVGLVYAAAVQDAELTTGARQLARIVGVPDTSAGAVEAFALGPTAYDTEQDVAAAEAALRRLDGIDEGWPAALLVAKAASFSPARVTPALAARAGARLPPAALVELITWIAIQQLLHRLGTYFTPD